MHWWYVEAKMQTLNYTRRQFIADSHTPFVLRISAVFQINLKPRSGRQFLPFERSGCYTGVVALNWSQDHCGH